jgi:hypothetical protein
MNGLTASIDGKWFAYFQRNPQNDVNEFVVWKCSQTSETEHEIEPYTQVNMPLDESQWPQACFNSDGTHVACLGEWNRVHVVDLRRLDAPTEFYRCDSEGPQALYDAGDHFVWLGQDEFVRIIDLTTKHLTMWRYRMKNTKYLFVQNRQIIHMTDDGVVRVYKANLRDKRCSSVCYAAPGRYEDITIEEYGRIKLHKKDGKHHYIDL